MATIASASIGSQSLKEAKTGVTLSTDPKVGTKPPQSTTAPLSTCKNLQWVDALIFWSDWVIKVLGVAAAVVFGIWAPLSYGAANSNSANDDAAQSSIIKAAFTANSQAASAFMVQKSAAARQVDELDAMNNRLVAIGQLSLLEFCLGRSKIAACTSFASAVPITSLVSYLATATNRPDLSTTTFATSTSRVTATTSATPTSGATANAGGNSSTGSAPSLQLPAILGIVFAVILLLGIVAGIFVARLRRLRRKETEELQ